MGDVLQHQPKKCQARGNIEYVPLDQKTTGYYRPVIHRTVSLCFLIAVTLGLLALIEVSLRVLPHHKLTTTKNPSDIQKRDVPQTVSTTSASQRSSAVSIISYSVSYGQTSNLPAQQSAYLDGDVQTISNNANSPTDTGPVETLYTVSKSAYLDNRLSIFSNPATSGVPTSPKSAYRESRVSSISKSAYLDNELSVISNSQRSSTPDSSLATATPPALSPPPVDYLSKGVSTIAKVQDSATTTIPDTTPSSPTPVLQLPDVSYLKDGVTTFSEPPQNSLSTYPSVPFVKSIASPPSLVSEGAQLETHSPVFASDQPSSLSTGRLAVSTRPTASTVYLATNSDTYLATAEVHGPLATAYLNPEVSPVSTIPGSLIPTAGILPPVTDSASVTGASYLDAKVTTIYDATPTADSPFRVSTLSDNRLTFTDPSFFDQATPESYTNSQVWSDTNGHGSSTPTSSAHVTPSALSQSQDSYLYSRASMIPNGQVVSEFRIQITDSGSATRTSFFTMTTHVKSDSTTPRPYTPYSSYITRGSTSYVRIASYTTSMSDYKIVSIITLLKGYFIPDSTNTSTPTISGEGATSTSWLTDTDKPSVSSTLLTVSSASATNKITAATTPLSITSSSPAKPTELSKFAESRMPLTYVNLPAHYFYGFYCPVLLAVLYQMLIGYLYTATKMMEPFAMLSSRQDVPAKDFLWINYLSANDSFEAYTAMVSGHWMMLVAAVVYSGAQLLSPLSSEIIGIYPGYFQTDEDHWITGAALWIHPEIARVMQGILALICLLLLGLWFLLRRMQAHIYSDPSSISGVASLIHHPETVRTFGCLSQTSPKEQINEKLAGSRWSLDFYRSSPSDTPHYGLVPTKKSTSLLRTSELPDQQADLDPGSSQTTLHAPSHSPSSSSPPAEHHLDPLLQAAPYRKKLRTQFILNAALLVFTLGLLSIIIAYHFNYTANGFEKFMDAQNFGPRFLFTSIGIFIKSQWSRLERRSVVFAPFSEIYDNTKRGEPAPARSTIFVTRTLIPVTTLAASFRRKTFTPALLAFNCLLAEALVIILPSIPFDATQLYMAAVVSRYTAMGVLGFEVCVMVGYWGWKLVRWKARVRLPRDPNTLGAMALYVAGTRMARELGEARSNKGWEGRGVILEEKRQEERERVVVEFVDGKEEGEV